MDIFCELVNVGENFIAISSNREVGNEIYVPYIKLSGWNRNRIQQPIKSSSEVIAPLTHATTLDEPFHIRDQTWLPHMMSKSLERFMDAHVAKKVTEMKFSK